MQADQKAPPPRRLGTVKDLAQLLSLPRSTIYERSRDGRLPGTVRVGQRVLFDMGKVHAWIDAGGDVPPVEDI